MDGSEALKMRRVFGMSQLEFGKAIGVSRETIGRIERSSEHLDRRTELAMRYIAEERVACVTELREIHEAGAHVLDQAAVCGAPTIRLSHRLHTAVAHWGARGGGLNEESCFAAHKVCWPCST